jgi:peptidoglycan/LPS O-acetylase OafA/YrhL
MSEAGGSRRFVARRIARLVPLWWLVTTFTLALVVCYQGGLAANNMSLPNALQSYLLLPYPRPGGEVVPVVSQGWTLYFEVFFYGAFAASIALGGRKAPYIAAVILLFEVWLFYHYRPAHEPMRFWANPILIEFILGMVLCKAYEAGVRIPAGVAALMVIVGACILFRPNTFNGGWVWLGREWEWGLPASAIDGGLALGRWPPLPRMARPVILLGDASYALYLTHALVYWWVRAHLAERLGLAVHPYVMIVLMFLCAAGVAVLLFELFERPVIRYLHGVFGLSSRAPSQPVLDWRRMLGGAAIAAMVYLLPTPFAYVWPRSVDLQSRGMRAAASGHYADAIDLYTRAMALSSDTAALRFLRGSALLATSKFQAAAIDFRMGLKLDPGNVTLTSLLKQADAGIETGSR